jgi:hypothetical protein
MIVQDKLGNQVVLEEIQALELVVEEEDQQDSLIMANLVLQDNQDQQVLEGILAEVVLAQQVGMQEQQVNQEVLGQMEILEIQVQLEMQEQVQLLDKVVNLEMLVQTAHQETREQMEQVQMLDKVVVQLLLEMLEEQPQMGVWVVKELMEQEQPQEI